jgi:hypothetical protein
MINRRFSRGEILAGAGAVTVAGLTGCGHSASSLIPGTGNAFSQSSALSKVGMPNVTVHTPTGEAIQKAIDHLPGNGGVINLISPHAYVIGKPLVLKSKSNVKLMGRGPLITHLVAKSGAVLQPAGYSDEYLLLIEGGTNLTVSSLTIDTANEDNVSGSPRIGIGASSANTLTFNSVTFVNNLGPNGFNAALSLNDCSKVTADRCVVSQSRTGFSFTKTSFSVNECLIEQCESLAPHYPGPTAGISIVSCSGGVVTLSQVGDNKNNAGIYVNSSTGIHLTDVKIAKTQDFAGHGNDAILIGDCPGSNRFNRVHVFRCQMKENSGAGIGIKNSSRVDIDECAFVANAGGGVSLNGGTANVQVHSNHFSNPHKIAAPGIQAGNAPKTDSAALIHDNSVHGFGVGVSMGSHSTGFTVENNDLRSNTKCIVNNGSGNVLNNNLC